MNDAEAGAGVAPGERAVAGAVVGQNSFDRDTAFGEPGDGALQDADRGLGLLISADLGIGDSGVVIDDGVQIGGPSCGLEFSRGRALRSTVVMRFRLPCCLPA